MTDANSQFPMEISCGTLHSLVEQGAEFLLLDCREQHEYDIARIAGSVLIPMSELQARVGELSEHRASRIIVHCHHGMRSLRVTQWLRQQGFTAVQNLAGGIDEWSTSIDATVPRY